MQRLPCTPRSRTKSPFVLIVGQVPVRNLRRDAFQEIDYRQMFGAIAKWTAEVSDPVRIAETLLRALRTATSGTPGPVVIAVPEDVLTAPAAAGLVAPQAALRAAPTLPDMLMLRRLIESAVRPLVLCGRSLDRPGGREALHAFLEDWNLPAVVSFRSQDLLANHHRLYAGDMGLANPPQQMALLRRADLLLALGVRFTDITSQGYAFPDLVRPQMQVAHVHPDPSAIGMHFSADLAIVCDPQAVLAALGRAARSVPGPATTAREEWIGALAAMRRAIAMPRTFKVSDGVPFEDVAACVSRDLPSDAIVTVDAGSFGAPVYRVIPFAPPQRLLAPISGAMGFGIPAAVAAALREPARRVVCFVGDGGLLMTGGELAVALERKLPLKMIVSENGSYGSILVQQERDYPGRAVGTMFTNPDLALFGRAFGFEVTRIAAVSELDALPEILGRSGPQFVIVATSLEAARLASKAAAASGDKRMIP